MMAPREPGRGRGPSPHDSTGPRGRGDKQRPVTGGWTPPPTKPRPPLTFGRFAGRFIAVVLVVLVLGAAAYVAWQEKQPARVPSNQPASSTP